MPKVTVVIPSYNHERFLAQCLESIFTQTFTDLDVVLIDDGSKDNSVALARRIADEEPRLRVYVNERNLGTYGTEQKGLDLSDSEYVAIMNSDDLWHPEKLAIQVAKLDQMPDVPLCYVLGHMVDDKGQLIDNEDVHLDWPKTERQEVLPYLLYENRILASGVLFRREGLRFETTCRYSGDWVALLERCRHSEVACVPERLTFWRQHDNNTYLRSVKQMREEIRVRRTIHDTWDSWFLTRLDRERVRYGLMRNAHNLFALYIYFGDRTAARHVGWRGVRSGTDRKSALKRTLSGYLPAEFLRRYFWRYEPGQMEPLNVLRPELENLPPLEIR